MATVTKTTERITKVVDEPRIVLTMTEDEAINVAATLGRKLGGGEFDTYSVFSPLHDAVTKTNIHRYREAYDSARFSRNIF